MLYDNSCGSNVCNLLGSQSLQVKRELEKAKMEEARLRQDLNKAREREKEEKKRVRSC